ncbi:hypothetical protein Ocin01_17372, partial [Orchesella cincta]
LPPPPTKYSPSSSKFRAPPLVPNESLDFEISCTAFTQPPTQQLCKKQVCPPPACTTSFGCKSTVPPPPARFLGNKSPPQNQTVSPFALLKKITRFSPPPPQEITRFVGNKLYPPPTTTSAQLDFLGTSLAPSIKQVRPSSSSTESDLIEINCTRNNAPHVKEIIRSVGNNSPPPPLAKEIIGNKSPLNEEITRFVGNKSPPSPSQENTQTLVWPWVLVPIVLISFIIWMRDAGDAGGSFFEAAFFVQVPFLTATGTETRQFFEKNRRPEPGRQNF